MSGQFSIGGLMSGLDTNAIVEQLIQLERQPILRIQQRIAALTGEQDAIRSLRTTLQGLRSRAQDFQLSNVLSQFAATSSEEGVLTVDVSGENPVIGAYDIEVLQLASATVATSSARLGAAIDPAATLESSRINGEITEGQFSINGVAFTVDPTTDSLNSILGTINASTAGVVASYDAASDTVIIENATAGDTTIINFTGSDDDSNFLSAINVLQATQYTNAGGSTEVTSTRNLGAVDPSAELSASSFAGGAMTSGSFRINGITISIDAGVGGDSLSDVIQRISDSDAGVTASYDTSSDTIRVVSDTLGSRTVGFASDTSNFLSIANLDTAVQEAGSDSQFTINGGEVLTRNTNEVTDAIGGVTLNLLSAGTSTLAVASDDEAIVEGVQEFIDEFNASLESIHGLVGQDGALENDFSIRVIENYLRGSIFQRVEGASGEFQSLVDIGIASAGGFEAGTVQLIELDQEAFLEALREDRGNVEALFTNAAEDGVADFFETYLEDVTGTSGFLHERSRSSGSIDRQIDSMNERIDRLEESVARKEARLQAQFLRLEQFMSGYQAQNQMLAGMGSF